MQCNTEEGTVGILSLRQDSEHNVRKIGMTETTLRPCTKNKKVDSPLQHLHAASNDNKHRKMWHNKH